jgi:hypothetical protein
MATSDKKIAANRLNAQKSTGPTNTSSTRFNATKHGLLSRGITELDDAEAYQTDLHNLMKEKAPVGTIETLLVKQLAFCMVQLHRAHRFEAEYITSELNPPILESSDLGDGMKIFQPQVVDPGLKASLSLESIQKLVNTFQRYESGFYSHLFKTLHELERLQRSRHGEVVPAPSAVDVSVRVDDGIEDNSRPAELSEGPPEDKE